MQRIQIHSWTALTVFVVAAVPVIAGAQVPSSQSNTTSQDTSQQPIVVEGNEPKYVAPNTLDRIGRIWAPVKINGKGPFRLVLDTSANSSAIIASVADRLALPPQQKSKAKLIGVTGTSIVEMVNVDSMEVGELSLGGGRVPIVQDVFGGAEGVLAPKGFGDIRIYVDF
ncbi:MAG TPA: retropepsin-like aspartic protease, partial [Steroidobacteraceae bacterium]|nr:retropepsin-like aspartic protease [Steroidobacteraceae bacterium]